MLARPIVFGNWKMHGLREQALALAGALADRAPRLTGTLGIFPPFTVLHEVARRIQASALWLGGQDCHDRREGPFTGCISAWMLKDAGCRAVILGHSERRRGLGEDDAWVRRKAEAAIASGLLVVLCIGESEEEWQAGRRQEVLARQLAGSLPEGANAANLVVAYEPVWAIGTGRTPRPEEIAEIHLWLRGQLGRLLADGERVALLYGGSVKAANAGAIMAMEGVDGVLVGGASLDAEEFWRIYRAGGGA